MALPKPSQRPRPGNGPPGGGAARAPARWTFPLPYLAQVGILATVYFTAARIGLSLAAMHANVSLVWPPTGIALSALLLFGSRLWPGVALGAFLINASTEVSLATTAGIAAGNTLEAVTGAYLLRRVARFGNSLERLRDVVGFVAFAAVLSTTVSATVGVMSLCLGGSAAWAVFGSLWWQWWLGDLMGDLVVAPVLLTWGTRPRTGAPARQLAEAGALLVSLAAVTTVVFRWQFPSGAPHYPLAYTIFPLVIWAALRFGPRGAATATLAMSTIAIWGTAGNLGPFHGTTLTESLLLLQSFFSVVAVTGLLMAAAISQRRQAEEGLRNANVRLQEAVQRAEEASRYKSEFLANMSHELRTPLNSIIGFSTVLGEGPDGPLTQRQQRYVSHIQTSGQHLLAIINDILDLSKVEAGRLQLRPESIRVQDAIEAAVNDIRFQAETKGVVVQLQGGEGLGTVWADPVRFKQILYNLMSNAVKFTPSGGRVTVAARQVLGPPHPPVDSGRPADGSSEALEIAVTDTGIGIKAENLGKLFREFTQLDASLARKYGGTGLGLALTKRLVELHGGTVTATSPGEGLGSTFTVTLPLRLPTLHGRILVVDDDASLSDGVAQALRNVGFEVEEVHDGEAALAKAEEAPPDLMILDLCLPGLHGLEVLRRIRTAGPTRRLPVIVLTGVEPQRVEEALSCGANEFLTKPFSVFVLTDAVARLLQEGPPARRGSPAHVDRAGL